MGDRFRQLIVVLMPLAVACAPNQQAPVKPAPPSPEVPHERSPIVSHPAPAAVVARVSERCSGELGVDGEERCTRIIRSENKLECEYQVRRDVIDDDGRHGRDVDIIRLIVAGDGAFHYRETSSSQRSGLTASGRDIETSTRIELEYREGADGAGRCPTLEGGLTECERDDVMMRPGADPCTAEFLS